MKLTGGWIYTQPKMEIENAEREILISPTWAQIFDDTALGSTTVALEIFVFLTLTWAWAILISICIPD